MNKVPYNKTALSYANQLQQLRNRGLIIEDEPKALHLLEVISYYRLSGYWYPLLADKQNHRFKSGATFETAFSIYKFDRELRLLVLRELEKIEVAVRAKMIYVLSHSLGPFWYLDSSNFSNPVKHADTLSKIGTEYSRTDEDFVKAFKVNSARYLRNTPILTPVQWAFLQPGKTNPFGNEHEVELPILKRCLNWLKLTERIF